MFEIYIFYYEKYYLSKSSWHSQGRKKMNPLDYCLYNRWTMFMPYGLMLLHVRTVYNQWMDKLCFFSALLVHERTLTEVYVLYNIQNKLLFCFSCLSKFMCPCSVLIHISILVVCQGQTPDSQNTIDIVPHPSILTVTGSWFVCFPVYFGWQESCNWVLCWFIQ